MKQVNKSMQGLRFLFALGVMLSHCYWIADYSPSYLNNYYTGFAFVSFFFMVSGYYANQSFRPDEGYVHYLRRKLIRIYPLYFCILLLKIAQAILLNKINGTFLVKCLISLFMLQTWVPDPAYANFIAVAWYVSSLVFCLAASYWIFRMKTNSKVNMKILLAGASAVLLTAKIVFAILYPTDNKVGYWLTTLCPLAGMADFLLGALLYEIKIEISDQCRALLQILSIFGIALCVLTKHYVPVNYSRAFYALPFVALVIIAFQKETKLSRCIFGNKVLEKLGDVSFEFYLLNIYIISYVPDFPLFVDIAKRSIALGIVILILISIAVAFCCSYTFNFVFKRIKKLRKRRSYVK